MTNMSGCGRPGALRALAGEAVTPTPAALFTWEFDYLWKVAGLKPWQLAGGDPEIWHRAQIALLERHQPDLIGYSGAGASATPPRLIEEDRGKWVVEDGNGRRYGLRKDSLALSDLGTGAEACFIADGWASCDILLSTGSPLPSSLEPAAVDAHTRAARVKEHQGRRT